MSDDTDPDETAGRRLYRARADTLARAHVNYTRRKVMTMPDIGRPSAAFEQWFDALPDYGEAPYMLAWRAYLHAREEAADEIEALAARIEELATRIIGLEAMLCDAQAEIERLRAGGAK